MCLYGLKDDSSTAVDQSIPPPPRVKQCVPPGVCILMAVVQMMCLSLCHSLHITILHIEAAPWGEAKLVCIM